MGAKSDTQEVGNVIRASANSSVPTPGTSYTTESSLIETEASRGP